MKINRILRDNPRPCRYGAHMGARDQFDPDGGRLYLQRVRMVDYCYAPDGTYWGAPSREHGAIYCGFNASTRVYVRAKSRAQATALILADYPSVSFYRR
jgi:hypothetical protein